MFASARGVCALTVDCGNGVSWFVQDKHICLMAWLCFLCGGAVYGAFYYRQPCARSLDPLPFTVNGNLFDISVWFNRHLILVELPAHIYVRFNYSFSRAIDRCLTRACTIHPANSEADRRKRKWRKLSPDPVQAYLSTHATVYAVYHLCFVRCSRVGGVRANFPTAIAQFVCREYGINHKFGAGFELFTVLSIKRTGFMNIKPVARDVHSAILSTSTKQKVIFITVRRIIHFRMFVFGIW